MSGRNLVDVAERRLRPIYDCLDNGNNKKALQEADKVLKKQKDFLCAKTLKALALLRLGRCDESAVILNEVHCQSPADDSTLQAMQICYREMHELELIADMYEKAHKVKPENEEILSALFMAYVRLGNYKQQHLTAMALHRLRPDKNPYYFWGVMSIVMQAETADRKMAKNMYLPLAERMCQKYLSDSKMEAEAEVKLYLMILKMLDKNDEALKVVQGELGAKLVTDPSFQEYQEAELLSKLERWVESNQIHKRLLRKDPDQWLFYVEYLKSAFALMDSGFTSSEKEESQDEENEADHTVEAMIKFLQAQIDKALEVKQKTRGPYLAQLLLCRYLHEKKLPVPEQLGTVYRLMKSYFKMFGDKQICFEDMCTYLDLLEGEDVDKLLDELTQDVALDNTDNGTLIFAKDRHQMQRHLTMMQLSRFAGRHKRLSTDDKYKLVDELAQRHTHGLQFGTDLLKTDLQYCDNYMLLAAHVLLDVWRATDSLRPVWQAVVLLERAIAESPSNFQAKLILIALYAKLGACAPSCILFETMEIKHIQQDALGYIIANHLSRQGNLAAVSQLFRTMLRFFTLNHKETTEYVISSYKFGSFVKIPEFAKFRSKLRNSLQYALAGAEQLLFEITYEPTLHTTAEQVIHHAEINPVSDVTIYEDICDNRDLDVCMSWDAREERVSEDDKKYSLEEELAWLRLRNYVIRILAASVHLSLHANNSNHMNGNSVPGEEKSFVQILTNLRIELAEHLKQSDIYEKPYNYKLGGPTRTGMTSYMSNQCGDIFLSAVDLVLYCGRLLDNGTDKIENDMEELMKASLVSKFKGLLNCTCSLVKEDGGEKLLQAEYIEYLTTVIEVLSHVMVLTGCCWRLLKPCQQTVAKKGKKKKGPAAMKETSPITFESYNELVSGLKEVCEQLEVLISDIVPQLLSIDMERLRIDSLQSAMKTNVGGSQSPNAEGEIDKEDEKKSLASALQIDDKQGEDQRNDETVAQRDQPTKKTLHLDNKSLVPFVWEKVTKSYKETAQNLDDFVKNKLEYIASIRL